MPVRTDRGRVAIYRRVWGWPLRSWRNLAITVLVAVVLGGGLAALAAAVGGSAKPALVGQPATATTGWPPAPTTTVQASATTTAAAIPPPVVSSAPAATTTAAPVAPPPPALTGPAAAKAVAGEFMARWVHHPAGVTSRQWADQLRPYVIPEYVVELESVDPANIPATAVIGPAAVVSATATVVEVTVPTDGGVVHLVVLAQHDGSWLVRSYDLAAG